MAYNQFSRAISPPDLYEPISDDLLLRGAMETYNRAGKLGQNLSAYKSKLFGTQTYGKDAEVLQDYENQFNEQVAELTKQGISSPEAISRFNSLVSQYTNNEDILNINKRISFYNNEVKKEQEAAEKNQIYKSKGKKSLEDYYNSGVYLKNPQNVSYTQGYIAPEIRKIQEELFKNHKDEIIKKVAILGKDGRTSTYQKVDGDKVASLWAETIKNDPSLNRYYQDIFDEQNEGVDWNTDGALFLQNAANKSLELANEYKLAGDEINYNKYLDKYQQQLEASQSPYSGETFKSIAFNDFVNKDANSLGKAHNSFDLEDIKADEIALENLRTSNDKWLYGEKLRMDAGYYENKGIPAKQESSNKTVYSITGEPVSAGALYNSLQAAFEGKEVGLNYLAPKIAKAQNIDFDPKRMKLIKNQDGTISLQELKNKGKENEKWEDVPNTKTDLNSAIGLFSGADKKSYDLFVNQLNKQLATEKPKAY